jgi:hypothetical protein
LLILTITLMALRTKNPSRMLIGNLPATQLRFTSMMTLRRCLLPGDTGQSMRYKYKPAHAANNKGYSGENDQLLQYVHVLLLISLICSATGMRRNPNCRINCPQSP